MPEFANRWNGKIYGTNTGSIFFDMVQEDKELTGSLRIVDSILGVSVYEYRGTSGDEIVLNCVPLETREDTIAGNITVIGRLNSSGDMVGKWLSTIGTEGTFIAHPHDTASFDDIGVENLPPEQLYNKTISLGSVRLFKDDLTQLVDFIKKDYTAGRAIITYSQRACELTKYADDFFAQLEGIDQLNYLKVVIQEPEAHGINRVAVIELVETGISEIRVSGINESWVLGKAESLYQMLKPKQNSLVTTYRKYGLNINSAIIIAMLITIPEIPDWKNRAVFVFTGFVLLNILQFIHNKFIPNTAIDLKQAKQGIFKRFWPSILSWGIAASSSVVAAYIFSLLKS